MRLGPLLYGMATFVPGVDRLRARPTGGTDSARYCYSVWLRHLVRAAESGLDPFPRVVAELGPGDSLGIGLAALLSGSDRYFAFDVVEYASAERNASVFEELVTLFRARAPIPGNDEFPRVGPHLADYAFPACILDEGRLERALEPSRVERIGRSLGDLRGRDSLIRYKVPWYGDSTLERDSVDMIYSQAVLEHVDDLRGAYHAMHSWLRPGGYVSHQIDFTSHGISDDWNGHWAFSDLTWRLIRGGRPYLLNREPHSTHVALLTEEGFGIVCDDRTQSASRLRLSDLARGHRSMSAEDLVTSGAFIQAAKSA